MAETKELVINYVHTKDIVADVLTKPLAPDIFRAFPAILGLTAKPRV